MLTIRFGDMENAVFNTSVYFKFNYEPSWLEDPFVREMILDVDSSRVLGNGAIDSPVLGVIAPVTLSGGVKTLILIDKVPNKVFNASTCGDNCAKWLLRIGERQDVTVNLRHIMDFGDDPLRILVANTGDVVTSMDELVPLAGRFV